MGKIPKVAETECLSVFQRVLSGAQLLRGHSFDFLRGDPTLVHPRGTLLPVDGYFPEFKLVVEYLGRQHFNENRLFDRRPGRADQRRRYQERRIHVLTQHGMRLVRVSYDEPLTEEMAIKKLLEVGIKL